MTRKQKVTSVFSQKNKVAYLLLAISFISFGCAPVENVKALSLKCLNYQEKREFDNALVPCQAAVKKAEQKWGDHHIKSADTLVNLAKLYHSQSKGNLAQPLYKRALNIYEATQGKNAKNKSKKISYKTALILSALGNFSDQNLKQDNPLRYTKTIAYRNKALQIFQEISEEDSLDSLENMRELGSLYLRQKKYKQAEFFYQKTLAIYQKEHSQENLKIADTFTAIGYLYQAQNKHQKAEASFQNALTLYETEKGLEYFQTIEAMEILAGSYQNQEKLAEAEALYIKVLKIRAKHSDIGPTNPDSVYTLKQLEALYLTQKDYEKAEAILKELLALEKSVIITAPVSILTPQEITAMNTQTKLRILKLQEKLADLNTLQKRFEEAELSYKQNIDSYKKIHGPKHTDTAQAIHQLATMYLQQKEYDKAEPLLKKSISTRKKLAVSPQNTARVHNETEELIELYLQQKKYSQAISVLENVLIEQTQRLEAEDPSLELIRKRLQKLKRPRISSRDDEPQALPSEQSKVNLKSDRPLAPKNH